LVHFQSAGGTHSLVANAAASDAPGVRKLLLLHQFQQLLLLRSEFIEPQHARQSLMDEFAAWSQYPVTADILPSTNT